MSQWHNKKLVGVGSGCRGSSAAGTLAQVVFFFLWSAGGGSGTVKLLCSTCQRVSGLDQQMNPGRGAGRCLQLSPHTFALAFLSPGVGCSEMVANAVANQTCVTDAAQNVSSLSVYVYRCKFEDVRI